MYLIFGMMCLCVFSQLHFLACGLHFFDAVYCIPIHQCFFIVMSIIGGVVYFDEFSEFDTKQFSASSGLLVTVVGVIVLTVRGSGIKKTLLGRFRVPSTSFARRLYDSLKGSKTTTLRKTITTDRQASATRVEPNSPRKALQ